jgi:hypothetical protein
MRYCPTNQPGVRGRQARWPGGWWRGPTPDQRPWLGSRATLREHRRPPARSVARHRVPACVQSSASAPHFAKTRLAGAKCGADRSRRRRAPATRRAPPWIWVSNTSPRCIRDHNRDDADRDGPFRVGRRRTTPTWMGRGGNSRAASRGHSVAGGNRESPVMMASGLAVEGRAGQVRKRHGR